ncbi:methyl transferase-like protein [Halococcus morrhuae DSM 1307]|uniref:Methyl transferase-like protein n=1 Tax=Halococcus morrhuae DSM 1307 TaxID=931277 RepID=M0MIY8_HALMO|nr:class I SAM-dependent methyltransferase [Halococcus morrhuae]EMA45636.1 methyl transferase-like protein [Halococcus morrhuae DSM 1307]
MHAPGDVALFERVARYYERFSPATNERALRAGLALADRDIDRALDVGGGTGRAARVLDSPERVVVDAAGEMLAEARRVGLDCVRGDGATLPVADDSVDAVVIVDALHHISDRAGALAEAERVLRPGGVVVCREFNRATVRGQALAAGEHIVGFDSEFFTPEELARAVERTGLDAAIPDRGFGFTVAGVKR